VEVLVEALEVLEQKQAGLVFLGKVTLVVLRPMVLPSAVEVEAVQVL